MNQEKIGKLIAKLRKEKGLTQQQLGDKVNVGDRAVSKWERGINLPDIAIINELSKILGITSDELLKGELNKTKDVSDKKKFNYKWLLLLIPVLAVIGVILYIVNSNDDVYLFKSLNKGEYYVNGKLTLTDDKLSIYINKIQFNNYNFNQIVIKNYEYYLLSNNEFIYSYGNNQLSNFLSLPISIRDFLNTFSVDYKIEGKSNIDKVLNNDLLLKFVFIDENDNQITKDVPIKILHKNKWF